MNPDKTVVQPRELWLLAATFFVAVAGLIYELIAATISSYLLGDSIRQFSFVIGVFLTSMGFGAWLSRFVSNALTGFVRAQIALGIIGGFCAPLLFMTYAFFGVVGLPLYSALILIGVLSGMEIPLIARVLKDLGATSFRFENVLTADYIGALAASLLFPLLIIPHLSLMAASLVFGCLNLMVAGISVWLFRNEFRIGTWIFLGTALLASFAALIASEKLVSVVDANLFEDDVILTERTQYQTITVTRFQDRTRLFLNHSIQFDTLDEYRYHEALVHPAMASATNRTNILILGGGDGMAAREVLRYDDVESVTLVDLDPRVTQLFRDNPQLSALNSNALNDPRVTVINQDAWQFASQDQGQYEMIILDLPDPKSLALSKLYSIEFYSILTERLSANGVIVTQAGSPLFAREAFWSIAATLENARNPIAPGQGLTIQPYHTYVPSFGQWGFIIARNTPLMKPVPQFPDNLQFMTSDVWNAAQVFSADTNEVDVDLNSIRDHRLIDYYEAGWNFWFR
ncbi:polyamine aminopropyltransferase [Parasulfitobacter algicola]|uniref:Polyamine aminopropyltransferase n=1 Tax=Parasulfitobacter algicola TaxID=2614809 RepID=A0ABX2IKD6_9RHOB|nr:polyamine aminopropyltransferase [Sulfitobacter algicola]NSX53341.1 polyamine aminopropyltransferase [Sulfitobacter algicola]